MKRWLFAVLAMAVMLAAGPAAHAGPVLITVTSDGDPTSGFSDTLTVVDKNTGANIFPPLNLSETDETNGVTFFASVPGSWNSPNTLEIFEPSGSISDLMVLQNKGGRAFIYFTSDDDNGNLGPVPPQNPTFTFTEGANGITVFGNFSIVPEPASLTLLGIGIAGLAGYGWRRRKQASA